MAAASRTILFWVSVALAGTMALAVVTGRCTTVQLIPGAVAVAYAVLARFLLVRRPDNAVSWILGLLAVVFLLGGLADGYVERAPAGDPALVLGVAGWLSQVVWNVWLPALVAIALPLLFPTGRPPSRRWHWVAYAGAAGVLSSTVGFGLAPGVLETRPPVENPFGVAGADEVLAVLDSIGSVLSAVAIVGAAAALIVRLRRSRGLERQQLKWFAYVASMIIVGLSAATLSFLDETATWSRILAPAGWFTALVMAGIGIPMATAFAVLRHRLYDIDVVIKRTLTYAVLTAALGGAYLVGVLLLQLVISPSSDLAVAASTLLVASLFRPVRDRVQRLVDRRFSRSTYVAARTIEAFGARVRDEDSLDALSAQLREVVGETLQPSHVSVWLKEPTR